MASNISNILAWPNATSSWILPTASGFTFNPPDFFYRELDISWFYYKKPYFYWIFLSGLFFSTHSSCDRVVSLSSTSSPSTSGNICTPTSSPKRQPIWCCLDGRVNDIKGCDELAGNDVGVNTNRCPSVAGCPTDRMRMDGYLPEKKNLFCQFL